MGRARVRVGAASAGLAALCLVHCASGSSEGPRGVDPGLGTEAPAGCELRLTEAIPAHACLRAEHGPFEARSAPLAPAGAPEIDAPNTAWELQLQPAVRGGFGGHVTFEARRHSHFVFFTRPAVALSVVDPRGTPLTPQLVQAPVDCAVLEKAAVFWLEESQRYTLEIDADSDATVALVVEDFDAGDAVPDVEVWCPNATPDAGPMMPDGGGASTDAGMSDGGTLDGGASDAGNPLDGGAPDGGLDCVPTVAPSVVEHGCLHARHGPFENAIARSGDQREPGDVDAPHTLYRVRDDSDGGGVDGVVTYRPVQGGEHGFFMDPLVMIEVRGEDGAVLPPVTRHETPDCEALEGVVVVDLEAGARHSIHFITPDHDQLSLVIERLLSIEPRMPLTSECGGGD